jgi:hypothetical protein
MIASTPQIDWRIGYARILLPAAVHGVAVAAAVEALGEWWGAWLFIGVIGVSAVDEIASWVRERGRSRTLALIPSGIAIDTQSYRARRAWLGPGWTVVWLSSGNGRLTLLHVMRGEVTIDAHAALRRHVKALEYV